MHTKYRRVVTGMDNKGKSRILFDDGNGFESSGGATSVALLWQSKTAPAENTSMADAAREKFTLHLDPGATKCIMVDVAPTEGLMPPGMHATNTLDYVVILSGALSLYLDEEEVEVGTGDVVVNRGNIHAWRNKGPDHARMLVVNVDAAPVGEGGTFYGIEIE